MDMKRECGCGLCASQPQRREILTISSNPSPDVTSEEVIETQGSFRLMLRMLLSCVLHTTNLPVKASPENAITTRISSPLHAQASTMQTAAKRISRSVQQHAQSRESQPDR
jgi:hypothetical protein